ncbi:MAG: sensor histidine kinase [Longimicrobiales bacterium]
MNDCPLAIVVAGLLRENRELLVGRWLERIAARVSLHPNRIFPSDQLLNHVPVLVDGIADYIEDPADEISADVPVVAKAAELGALRHAQGFEAQEILKEYEILGGVMFHFVSTVVDDIDQPCSRSELLACAQRMFRAIAVIQSVTTTQFLLLAGQQIVEREQRLNGFNRALSHEIKNRIGTIRGAVEMLGEDFVLQDEALRDKFRSIARENTDGMERVIHNLIELSRARSDRRQHHNVQLQETAAEVKRQLRDYAAARGVEVRIVDDLPDIEVPSSLMEIALSNYVSNAIKYHDPAKTDRWVEVRAYSKDPAVDELVVEVVDNGIGVEPAAREHLFQRFYRAHEEAAEGIGLGLTIVKEAVESVGGSAWADFDRDGVTVFGLTLPCRRAVDRDEPEPPAVPASIFQ